MMKAVSNIQFKRCQIFDSSSMKVMQGVFNASGAKCIASGISHASGF